jgi:hypothetical protein
MEVNGQLHAPAALTPKERASRTHCTLLTRTSRKGKDRYFSTSIVKSFLKITPEEV